MSAAPRELITTPASAIPSTQASTLSDTFQASPTYPAELITKFTNEIIADRYGTEVAERSLLFSERLQILREAKDRVKALEPSVGDRFVSDDGIPIGLEDLSKVDHLDRSDYARQVNLACDSIGIKEIYDRLSKGKYANETGDELQISCPNPEHPDEHPSASMNISKGLFTCYKCCAPGTDKYAIAAYAWSYPVPIGTGPNFWEIKKRLAKELRGLDYEPTPRVPNQPPSVDVTKIDLQRMPTNYPTFNIKHVLPDSDNFLRAYVDETSKDDVPEEFHLWCALAVLSVAVGRKATIPEPSPITGNLAICLTGATTVGKSRALSHAVDLVHSTLPWDGTEEGVKVIDHPGSGEHLVKQHVNEIEDPSNPKKATGVFVPVKSIVRFEELSTFAGKSGARGSTLGQMVMALANGDRRIGRGSMTHGTDLAKDAFSTVVTTTQPRSLQYLFGDRERVSGLLNRFLFIQGVPKKRRARGGATLNLSIAKEHLRRIRDWAAQKDHALVWDGDAGRLFDDVFENQIAPLQEKDETSLLGRLDLTMKRLILLFACNGRSDSIRLEHVQSAVALLDYLRDCYRILDVDLTTSTDDLMLRRILTRIVEYTKKEKYGPTAGDLNRLIRRKDYKTGDFLRLCENAEKLGLIYRKKMTIKHGQERERWFISVEGSEYLSVTA